jgi:hypothetical protein
MKGHKLLWSLRYQARELGHVGRINSGSTSVWRERLAQLRGRRRPTDEDINYDLFTPPYTIHLQARSTISNAVQSNRFTIVFDNNLNINEVTDKLDEIMKNKLSHLHTDDKVQLTVSSQQIAKLDPSYITWLTKNNQYLSSTNKQILEQIVTKA